MDNKIDRNLLHQLNDEIKNTPVEDEQGRELLRVLENEIQALLERFEGNPIELHPTIIQYLENAFGHFEVTHPNLTIMISKVLGALSTAGI